MTEISTHTFSPMGCRIFFRGMHQMGVEQDPTDGKNVTKATKNEAVAQVGSAIVIVVT